MNEITWDVGGVLVVLAGWIWMNHQYRLIWGRRLRWWAVWAALGANLFSFRLSRWEVHHGSE